MEQLAAVIFLYCSSGLDEYKIRHHRQYLFDGQKWPQGRSLYSLHNLWRPRMTAFGFHQFRIIHFTIYKFFKLAKAPSFLFLSIGSGHDIPRTFTFEPRSAIMGLAQILWRSLENILIGSE